MAVVVQYIVVRNGVQKMTFTDKKEADAYDKMLDISENLMGFIQSADFDIKEPLLEELSLYLAGNRDAAISILRGLKPKAGSPVNSAKDKPEKKALKGAVEEAVKDKPDKKTSKGEEKIRSKKKNEVASSSSRAKGRGRKK